MLLYFEEFASFGLFYFEIFSHECTIPCAVLVFCWVCRGHVPVAAPRGGRRLPPPPAPHTATPPCSPLVTVTAPPSLPPVSLRPPALWPGAVSLADPSCEKSGAWTGLPVRGSAELFAVVDGTKDTANGAHVTN